MKIQPAEAIRQISPFASVYLAGLLWILFSPTTYSEHPHLFLWTSNLIFSYLINLCILQRMCELQYEMFHKATIPFLIAGSNVFFGRVFIGRAFLDPILVLYGLCIGYTVFTYLVFAPLMVKRMCWLLKIKAFTIPYPNKATN